MPVTKYDDTALGERPPVTGTTGGGTASEKNPKAVGTPTIQSADGTANLRAEGKTKTSEGLSTPSGSKGNPPVTRYKDGEV